MPQAFSVTGICLLPCPRSSKERIRRLCYSCREGWHSPLAELTSPWQGHSVRASPCAAAGACSPRVPLCTLCSPTATPRAVPSAGQPKATLSAAAWCVPRAAAMAHGLPSAAQGVQNSNECVPQNHCWSLPSLFSCFSHTASASSVLFHVLSLSPPILPDDCTRHGLKIIFQRRNMFATMEANVNKMVFWFMVLLISLALKGFEIFVK